MRAFLQRVLLGDPAEQIELNLWDTIDELERQLLEAEAQGLHFKPAARNARDMLRVIGRR